MPEALRTYVSLRSEVRRSLGEVMSDGGAERVARYKRIGEMIDLHVLLRADRADYGGEVIQRLANDLEVRNQRLYEMLNVHRAFPISRPGGKLMWAHYVALSRIEDGGVRAAYETQAVRGAWSRQMLRDRIRAGVLQDASGRLKANWGASVAPTPRRGTPYTYRVKDVSGKSMLLDLGMGVEHELALNPPSPKASAGRPAGRAASLFKAGDTVKVERERGMYTTKPGDHRRLYTFKAAVMRVVDGDTVWVKVDHGFKFWQPQKIRFRGVDAPELPSDDGEVAKAWVEERLAGIGSVVITTSKVGMYGRYIADVFYRNGSGFGRVAKRGRYLNAEMVREGMAVGLG